MKRPPDGFSAAVVCSLFVLFASLAGCRPAQVDAGQAAQPVLAVTPPLPEQLPSPTSTSRQNQSPEPTPAEPAQSAPSPTPTPAPAGAIDICSPLDKQSIEALNQPDLLKNPFDPPRPGFDDGHFGIDLAYWADEQGNPMRGLPVKSVLQGTVAGVIANRQPYGYAVIIETPLQQLAPDLVAALDLPHPQHELQPALGLSCPDYDFTFEDSATSIYTLYAHLDQLPPVTPGEPISCGQEIGAVGTTGRSVNPHLHLEMRRGPAGITFATMAHYDNAASEEELRLYCLWRISGAFVPFDPLRVFTAAP